MDNHPVASITERAVEVAVIVAKQRREYTATNLERRGARLIQVRPGDL